MNRLADAFGDVTFLLLYIMEAHPGERVPQHGSFSDKLARPYFGNVGWNIFKTLRRAGKMAVYDFIIAFPVMMFKHIKKLFIK